MSFLWIPKSIRHRTDDADTIVFRNIILIGDAGNNSALSARIGNWEAGKGHRIAWMTKCSDAPNVLAFTPQ
jgi:hypothetical protein